MALAVADLIEAARDLHPSFARERQPVKPIYRFLTGWHRRAVQLVADRNADLVLQVHSVSMPLGDFDAGYASFPDHLLLDHGGKVVQGDIEERFHIIDYSARLGSVPRWSGYFYNGTLFLAGEEAWWTAVDSIEIPYVPMPAAITASSDELLLPDDAYSWAVAAIGMHMARRTQDESVVVQDYRADERIERNDYLEAAGARSQAKVVQTREVW
ncbi:MAG: hypothetical protein ACLFWG_09200 [Longimicrobiales bacterium]